jgi:23S rRNA pseudouridine1911/1915/1917 synthase
MDDHDDDQEESGSLTAVTADEAAAGARLDKFLAGAAGGLSRTRVQALIADGKVSLNGAPCADASRKMKSGDRVEIEIPPPQDDTPVAEDIPLDVVYEDEAMLVINKQAGLVVHPAAGHATGTLVNALLHHCRGSLSGIGGVRRPGIVHRLDKDTSGLMVVAKSDHAHQYLAAQLADRSLSRRYYAAVWRVPRLVSGKVEASVGRHPTHRLKMAANRRDARHAVTHYRVAEKFGDTASLLECDLETGRTHQIRVHMEFIGHPLIGDPLYGIQDSAGRALLKKGGYGEEAAEAVFGFPRQALHAFQISFIHPLSEEEMTFDAPLPPDLAELISILEQ